MPNCIQEAGDMNSGIGRIIAIVIGIMFAWWLFRVVLHMLFALIPTLIVIALLLLIYRLATNKKVI
jgi:hypothetical protein